VGCARAEQGWRHHAHDVRIAAHDVPVARVDRRRMHPYHQVVWTGQRLFDFFELEDLRCAVALLNNRFHVVNTSTLDPWLRHRRRPEQFLNALGVLLLDPLDDFEAHVRQKAYRAPPGTCQLPSNPDVTNTPSGEPTRAVVGRTRRSWAPAWHRWATALNSQVLLQQEPAVRASGWYRDR